MGRAASRSGTALLRGVPDSFVSALTDHDGALDVDRAREQHRAYADALRGAGLEVEILPADRDQPDCCFVEDTAVILGDVALITRPGAPSRRGEVEAVAAHLDGRFEVVRMEAPATLDGGDVLAAGDRLFVGRSRRTNDAGIVRLAEVAGAAVGAEVTPVDVAEDLLHLRSGVGRVADRTVLVAPGTVHPGPFAALRTLSAPVEERRGVNVLRVPGTEVVLVADGHPRICELLTDEGLEPRPLDISEFTAAGGGLTCLSVLLPPT